MDEEEQQTQTLEDVAARLAKSNDNQVAEMSQMKKELNVLKEIAESISDIRRMFAMQILEGGRQIAGAVETEAPEEEEKPVVKSVGVELPDSIKGIIGAIAGIVAGFVSQFGLIFAQITKFIKESKLLVTIEKMFLAMGKLFKADGAIGKLFQPGAKMVKAIIRPVEIMFESFAGLFKAEGAIGALFKEGKFLGKVVKAVEGIYASLSFYFSFFAGALKQVLMDSKIVRFFTDSWKVFTEAFKGIAEIFSSTKITLSGGKITKMFEPVFNFFGKFKVIGEAMGKVFSKLLPPILLIMQVVESVKTSFEFASEEAEKGSGVIAIAVSGIIGAFTGFVNFFLEIPDFLFDAVSWMTAKIFGPDNPVTKFLDSFSVVEMFTGFMKDVKDFIMTPGESMIKVLEFLKSTVTDAMDGLINFDFAAAFANPVDSVMRLVMLPYTLLKDAVAWIVGKLGFEEASEDLKNFDIVDTIKSVINAPFVLLGKAVNYVMGFLGFEFLKVDLESIDVVGTISKIILAPFNLLVKAVDWVLNLLGFDSLLSYMPDTGAILQKASDWLTGLIDGAIDWIKDKLSFFGGDSESREEKKERKEMQKMAEEQGIVKKEGMIGFRKNTIDDETLQSLTDEQLMQVTRAYADDEDLYPKLENEMERRTFEYQKMSQPQKDPATLEVPETSRPPQEPLIYQSQKNPGTLQTALQPQSVAELEDKYANPEAIIVGKQQTSEQMTQDMMISQASLDNTKTKQQGGGGQTANTTVASVNTSNVVNNAYTSMPQPSSRDNSDQTYIFRATGGTR